MGTMRVLWSWNYESGAYRFVDDGRRVTVQRSTGDLWESLETLGVVASAGIRSGNSTSAERGPRQA